VRLAQAAAVAVDTTKTPVLGKLGLRRPLQAEHDRRQSNDAGQESHRFLLVRLL
jgi:hypothetical protein